MKFTAALLLLATLGAVVVLSSHPLGTTEERKLKVAAAMADLVIPESLHTRRRLIVSHGEEHANSIETFVNTMDEHNYHVQVAKKVATLRALGFEATDLPVVQENGLPHDFADAHKRMLTKLRKAEEAWRKEKADNKARALIPEIKVKLDKHAKAEAESHAASTSNKPTGTRYLRELSPGVHEVAIDGGGSLPEHHRNLAGTAGDISKFLGTCTEGSNGHVYDGACIVLLLVL